MADSFHADRPSTPDSAYRRAAVPGTPTDSAYAPDPPRPYRRDSARHVDGGYTPDSSTSDGPAPFGQAVSGPASAGPAFGGLASGGPAFGGPPSGGAYRHRWAAEARRTATHRAPQAAAAYLVRLRRWTADRLPRLADLLAWRPPPSLRGVREMIAAFTIIALGVGAIGLAVNALDRRSSGRQAPDPWAVTYPPRAPAGDPGAGPGFGLDGYDPVPDGTPPLPPVQGSAPTSVSLVPVGETGIIPRPVDPAQPRPAAPGVPQPGVPQPGVPQPGVPQPGRPPVTTVPPAKPDKPTPPKPSPPKQNATAYSTIQGESYAANGGARTEADNSGGGSHVGFISTGDWVRYDKVGFTDDAAHSLLISASNGARQNRTGQIQVRLDSRSNSPIGSMTIPNNGNWFAFSTYRMSIAPTTGVHTVYLTFSSGQDEEFANVDWLTFRR